MTEPTSYTAENALAEALGKLAAAEDDNRHLKAKLQSLTKDARTMERPEWGGRETTRELEKLVKQNKEVSG